MGMGSLSLMLRGLDGAEDVPSLRIFELRVSLSLTVEVACSRKEENL
jgi:hypothetical protein